MKRDRGGFLTDKIGCMSVVLDRLLSSEGGSLQSGQRGLLTVVTGCRQMDRTGCGRETEGVALDRVLEKELVMVKTWFWRGSLRVRIGRQGAGQGV